MWSVLLALTLTGALGEVVNVHVNNVSTTARTSFLEEVRFDCNFKSSN